MDKVHILSEIKRTAAANGGKPLGMDPFFAETGIRRSDWLGRYWARWSEALAEADLEPNPFGSEALPEVELLDKLARLSQRLGRLPAKAEMMMERRRDDAFPNYTVYQRRLGDKRTQVELVSKFCIGWRSFDDVVSMCDRYLAERPATGGSAASRDVEGDATGFVYLLKVGKHFKIGKTNSVGRRERELASQLPERATLVHQIATDDPSGIERYWHERFRDRRGNGEWFTLEAANISAFRRRKFM